jgi:hypothetical protein
MIQWYQRVRRALCAVAVLVSQCAPISGHTASIFADSAFQEQWQQGEALAPNFWGPPVNAKDGRQESYKEATGGTRLVQYFDKGRMELTNGTVTNGLLATELLMGRIQLGETTFEAKIPPAIPVAGDPDSPGPTYAMLAALPRLFARAPTKIGGNVTLAVTPSGTLTGSLDPKTPATTVVSYDMTTGHNIPQAFADYREMAGLPLIGFAITEPFRTTVLVAGKEREVVVQAYERRVLTYAASNPDGFQVEMGNIGQHYYRWRYLGIPEGTTVPTPGTPTASTATATASTSTIPPAPTASAIPTTPGTPATPIIPLAPTATATPPATATPSAPPTSTPRPAINGPKFP